MADNKLTGDQIVNGKAGMDINHVMVDNNKAYIAATDINKGEMCIRDRCLHIGVVGLRRGTTRL